MQKIRIELTDLAPQSADRLMEVLRSYLSRESEIYGSDDIHLEVQDLSHRCLSLPVGTGMTLHIPFKNILYVTSDRHWCILHLTTGTRRFRINFSELRKLLPEEEFLCCNRGILLRLDQIRSAQKDCFLMSDAAAFPIRRNGRQELLLRWEQYRLDHASDFDPYDGFADEGRAGRQ